MKYILIFLFAGISFGQNIDSIKVVVKKEPIQIHSIKIKHMINRSGKDVISNDKMDELTKKDKNKKDKIERDANVVVLTDAMQKISIETPKTDTVKIK